MKLFIITGTCGAGKSTEKFDRIMRMYLQECEKAGLRPAKYADVDALVSAYVDLHQTDME